MKNYFEMIKNDPEIINRYEETIAFEDNVDKGDGYHGFTHVLNVTKILEKVLHDLNYDEEFIEEAKVAGILHDIGCNIGKKGHPERGYEFAKDYFRRKNINLPHEEMVLNAIKNHSNGFDTDDIMTLVLIFADKMDVTYERIAKAGYHVIGMRQYQYVRNISIEIKDGIININFECDNKINQKELEEYYFIPKILKAIQAFSEKLSLKPNVVFNGKKWELFYEKYY